MDMNALLLENQMIPFYSQPTHPAFVSLSIKAPKDWLNISGINWIIFSCYRHPVAKTASAQWAIHHALSAGTQTVVWGNHSLQTRTEQR